MSKDTQPYAPPSPSLPPRLLSYSEVFLSAAPTAGHTVVETLCLRKDSGTSCHATTLYQRYALLSHSLTLTLSVFFLNFIHLSRLVLTQSCCFCSGTRHSICFALQWRGMSLVTVQSCRGVMQFTFGFWVWNLFYSIFRLVCVLLSAEMFMLCFWVLSLINQVLYVGY